MKTQKDFYSVDDTQQVSLRSSKFRKYFTQAFLLLVLLSYKGGTNWKILVPHSSTCIAAWAVLAHSSTALARRNTRWVSSGETSLVH